MTAPLPLSSVSWVRRRRRRAYGSGRGRVPSGGHGAALLPGLLYGDKAVRSFSSSFQYLKFIGSLRVLARGGLVVGGLGLLLIQAPLWWQGRGTGAWDKGENWLGTGGGGRSAELAKKWISTQGFSSLGFYPGCTVCRRTGEWVCSR